MTEFLIHSDRCFIGDQFIEATLHIKAGKILKIYNGSNPLANIPYLDYINLIVMPGIIDAHVHINEPGARSTGKVLIPQPKPLQLAE